MLDVSIIIVNYNTWQLTANCIESVFEKTRGIEFEIILVDNASHDSSKDFFEKDKRIIYIYSQDNLGFGRANNLGFEVAQGKYLFCLNSDTLLVNNAIKILYDFMEEHTECGACGGNLYNADMHPAHSFNRRMPGIVEEIDQALSRKLSKTIYGKSYMHNFCGKPLEVAYITGADLMLRGSAIKSVGGFDSRFFMYFEETELQYRIRKSGLSIYSVPKAKIIHLEGASSTNSVKREQFFMKSRKIFHELTKQRLHKNLTNINFCLLNYIAFVLTLLGCNKKKKYIYQYRIKYLTKIDNTNHL